MEMLDGSKMSVWRWLISFPIAMVGQVLLDLALWLSGGRDE